MKHSPRSSGMIAVLPELLSSHERIQVLAYVSENREVTVTSVARGTGVSKPVVSRYLNLLAENELCLLQGRIFQWQANATGITLRRLLNIMLLKDAVDLPEWVKGIGVYGSWATGRNDAASDIDLWIMVERFTGAVEMATAKLEAHFHTVLGKEVNILILTPEKVNRMRELDDYFYRNLMTASVTIDGVPFDEA